MNPPGSTKELIKNITTFIIVPVPAGGPGDLWPAQRRPRGQLPDGDDGHRRRGAGGLGAAALFHLPLCHRCRPGQRALGAAGT